MPDPKPKSDKETREQKAAVEQIAKALNIDLNSEQVVKIGDWYEGPAKDIRKHLIKQSDLKTMREKDKSELQRQLEAEKTKLALEHQKALTQMAQQQRPQQSNGSFQDKVAAIYSRIKQDQNRLGFVHADDLSEILGMYANAVVSELQARDQMFGQLANGLDQWYGDWQKKSPVIDSLSGNYTDKQWGSFIEALAKDYPELPKSTIELMASAYEAAEGETPEQLQEAIREKVGSQVKELDTHRASIRSRQRADQEALQSAGLPGVGGQARPSLPEKQLRTADEIAEHFGSFDEPAA